MAYIVAGAMTDSSERWMQSMETVTAGETAFSFQTTQQKGRKQMGNLGDDGFDATAPENQRQNNALPAGEYHAVLVASEMNPTKNNDGRYLNCQFQIASGEFQNRRVFHKINAWINADTDGRKTSKEIGKVIFGELCQAVGVLNPKDSSELHGVPVLIRLNCKDNGEYGMQNNITKISPMPNRYPEKMPTFSNPVAASDNPWAS